MGIRSILVPLDNGRHTHARVAVAAALALQHDAHLVGLASSGWVAVPADVSGTLGLAAYQEVATQELQQLAQACVSDFRAQVGRLGLRSHEARIEVGHPADVMPRAARYCDLTVVTQNDPDESLALQAPQTSQQVLLQSGRPVLVLPYAGDCAVAPAKRVLAGWDGSREAARALHDALPWLRQAVHVEVAVFVPPEDADLAHGDLPGADIGLWLARHGVRVEARHLPTQVAAGEALLSHAADMGADLIVAGGYGHSRLREAVLGGVTRTLMNSSPTPVLLSH
ncbi:universal stress protein [Roseateles saccharophilus]|uniref:Nucleotide-binding universal stress UspA family protein n=1 Tax=Roseateles saccharophilus TaxID=304 RepID=A0A4R3UGM9_ROSSA|nr:universal stress protein [Roseateles saccharophilus]MDG0834299.1 universal stress protein [Roseateles saccharophilus]TCU90665.1 nucleotide-binding universal stress UspA family protein [Roseateles saccharophilus]